MAMNNVSHKNKCNTGTSQVYVGPPSITLIKSKINEKSDTYFVNIKFRRDPMSEKSDLYEFKMALFDNGNPEELLLFVCNFNMNL